MPKAPQQNRASKARRSSPRELSSAPPFFSFSLPAIQGGVGGHSSGVRRRGRDDQRKILRAWLSNRRDRLEQRQNPGWRRLRLVLRAARRRRQSKRKGWTLRYLRGGDEAPGGRALRRRRRLTTNAETLFGLGLVEVRIYLF